MVSVLGKLLKEGLAAEINNKHYISVMADGATDAGGLENETILSISPRRSPNQQADRP